MPRLLSGSTVVGVVLHLIVTVGAVLVAVAIGMLVLGWVLATADGEGQAVEIGTGVGWIVAGLAAALVGAVALAVFALRGHAWARWSLIGIHILVAAVVIVAVVAAGSPPPALLVLALPSLIIAGLLALPTLREIARPPVGAVVASVEGA